MLLHYSLPCSIIILHDVLRGVYRDLQYLQITPYVCLSACEDQLRTRIHVIGRRMGRGA